MGWFAEADSEMEHEGAVGLVLDSFEAAPVVDVHVDGVALVEAEGFRVVGWAPVCSCGWSGPLTPRCDQDQISSYEGYSPDGYAPPFAQGWCVGSHRMHVDAVVNQ